MEELYNAIMEDQPLLLMVLETLSREAPLPPHVAQPLVKVLKGLLAKQGGALTEYLLEHGLPAFWRHMETHEMGNVLAALLEVRNDADELEFARSRLLRLGRCRAWLRHGEGGGRALHAHTQPTCVPAPCRWGVHWAWAWRVPEGECGALLYSRTIQTPLGRVRTYRRARAHTHTSVHSSCSQGTSRGAGRVAATESPVPKAGVRAQLAPEDCVGAPVRLSGKRGGHHEDLRQRGGGGLLAPTSGPGGRTRATPEHQRLMPSPIWEGGQGCP